MSNKNDGDKYRQIMSMGNFTKHAIENFEQNIVNEKDYLEKVKEHESSEKSNNLH